MVGRIGRAHGLRGEVAVEPRTDEPARRFADGAVLATHGRAHWPSLTVVGTRTHQGRLLVRFEEIADRTAAESARGTELVVRSSRTSSRRTPRSSTTTSWSGSGSRPSTARSWGS